MEKYTDVNNMTLNKLLEIKHNRESIIKEVLEEFFIQEEPLKLVKDNGYQQGRTDGFNECRELIKKIAKDKYNIEL